MTSPATLSLGTKTIVESNVKLQSERATIRIGRGCYLDTGVVVVPPSRDDEGEDEDTARISSTTTSSTTIPAHNPKPPTHLPVSIGQNTHIGKNCTVLAAAIGSNCVIEDGCYIGNRSIVKDNVHICAGSIVADDSFFPPFAVVKGVPAKLTSMNHESWSNERKTDSAKCYHQFQLKQQQETAAEG